MLREWKFILVGIIFVVFFALSINHINQMNIKKSNEKILIQEKLEKEKKAMEKAIRKDNLKKIKPIYQNVAEYELYHCNKNGLLQGSYAKKACKMVNFMMVNNAYNDMKVDISDLRKLGYDCDFDYKKAQLDFNYQNLLSLNFNGKFIKDMNYAFPNENDIISNNSYTFTLKDALDDGLPIMLWMVPNKDKGLKNGHLITVFEYKEKNGKIEYSFYDTFNRELKRDLGEFMQRWKIAEINILKK